MFDVWCCMMDGWWLRFDEWCWMGDGGWLRFDEWCWMMDGWWLRFDVWYLMMDGGCLRFDVWIKLLWRVFKIVWMFRNCFAISRIPGIIKFAFLYAKTINNLRFYTQFFFFYFLLMSFQFVVFQPFLIVNYPWLVFYISSLTGLMVNPVNLFLPTLCPYGTFDWIINFFIHTVFTLLLIIVPSGTE